MQVSDDGGLDQGGNGYRWWAAVRSQLDLEDRAWGSDGWLVGEEWKNEELKMTDSWELREGS